MPITIKKTKYLILFFVLGTFKLSYSQISDSIFTETAKKVFYQEKCQFYFENNWLPDAYIQNAYCACTKLPISDEANIIRELLKKQLQEVNDSLVSIALLNKNKYKSHQLSKRAYKAFIKKKITPIIYKHHLIAYDSCGCKGKPAIYPAWKKITTIKVKNCNFIWFSIRCFGSCSNKFGKW
jgi:hypothetical protein